MEHTENLPKETKQLRAEKQFKNVVLKKNLKSMILI